MTLLSGLTRAGIGHPISTPAEIYQFRRWRDAHAPGAYFGEPGWDILLRVWMARDTAKMVTAGQVMAEIAVPPAAFNRTLDQMLAEDMVRVGPGEGLSRPLTLTDRAAAFIDSVFHILTPADVQKASVNPPPRPAFASFRAIWKKIAGR